MRLEGDVSDEVGIRSVNLKNDNWFLDKTISFPTDSLIKDYELWYDFKVPEGAGVAVDEVVITVLQKDTIKLTLTWKAWNIDTHLNRAKAVKME